MVRGGPEVSFHEGSTRVPPGFHQVLGGPGCFEVAKLGDASLVQLMESGPDWARRCNRIPTVQSIPDLGPVKPSSWNSA